MIWSIVDTNVLVVANGNSHAGSGCMAESIRQLVETRRSRALIVDQGNRIFDEYGRHCSRSGQPGVGDEFFRWVNENQGWLRRVAVTPDEDRCFQEFPSDPALANFDRADRVFVAVSIAAASSDTPAPNRIVNAVDSDYSHHLAALNKAGVQVTELCPETLKPP